VECRQLLLVVVVPLEPLEVELVDALEPPVQPDKNLAIAAIVPLMNTALPTRITSRRLISSFILSPSRLVAASRHTRPFVEKAFLQIGPRFFETVLLNFALSYLVEKSCTKTCFECMRYRMCLR